MATKDHLTQIIIVNSPPDDEPYFLTTVFTVFIPANKLVNLTNLLCHK